MTAINSWYPKGGHEAIKTAEELLKKIYAHDEQALINIEWACEQARIKVMERAVAFGVWR